MIVMSLMLWHIENAFISLECFPALQSIATFRTEWSFFELTVFVCLLRAGQYTKHQRYKSKENLVFKINCYQNNVQPRNCQCLR